MYRRFLLATSLFFVSSVCLLSQSVPVEVVRSENKIVIEQKVYYVHIIKPGQTLYSISRAYNVPQKEILLENPNAYIGIQAGQALKIPFVPESLSQVFMPGGEEDGDFIYHTIETGQTLFFLSRAYDVEIEEIIRFNPGVDEVLSIGQVVRIPSRKAYVLREGFPTEDDSYFYHKVEQGETLYSLSRKYEVPVRTIVRENDRLMWGLKFGEFIRIPKHPSDEPEDFVVSEVPLDAIAAEPLPSDVFDLEGAIDAECRFFNYREFNRPFNVALMLPLHIDRNFPAGVSDNITQDDAGNGGATDAWLYRETEPFLMFYEGALLAVDSLVRAGLSVNLTIYDTQRDSDRVREIIGSPGFRDVDLIIGPVYPENLRIVSDWAHKNRINIVSPLTSRSEFLAGNPWLFQITPSTRVELEQASVFISNFPSSNFVLIHNNDPFERNLAEAFKNNIFRHFSYSSEFNNLVFKEIQYTNPAVNIRQSLVAGEKNIVIVPSSNQAFVSDILMRLNVLSRDFDITIFGLNDWQQFANLEVEYLHNMELHFASPFFIDFGNKNVRNFVRRFRENYKTDPSPYGFMGYDIMFYFLQAMKNYGRDFHECLPIIRTELLQADFLFRKTDHLNGFENNGISIVKYDKDLSIRRLGLNTNIY
jgi:LysM repeat protein